MTERRSIHIGAIENSGPNTLVALLRNAGNRCEHIDIAVAFITAAGLNSVLSLLQKTASRGTVQVLTGLYQGFSETKALCCCGTKNNEVKGSRCTCRVTRIFTGTRGKATFLSMDVSSSESIRNAANRFATIATHLNVLINNAGIYPDEGLSILTLPRAQLTRTFETNTFGPLEVTQAFNAHEWCRSGEYGVLRGGSWTRAPKYIHVNGGVVEPFFMEVSLRLHDGTKPFMHPWDDDRGFRCIRGGPGRGSAIRNPCRAHTKARRNSDSLWSGQTAPTVCCPLRSHRPR